MWYSAVGCSMMLTLSLLTVPLLAVAQPAGQMRRIGLLTSGGALSIDFERYFEAFRQGLRDLGWVEGQNLTIAYRTAENHPERLPALAAELVGLPVEVIVTMGLATRAAQDATSTIPIVMGGDPNPVQAGFIASLARRQHHGAERPATGVEWETPGAAQGSGAPGVAYRRAHAQHGQGECALARDAGRSPGLGGGVAPRGGPPS